MTVDDYLRTVLRREAVNTAIYSPVRRVQLALRPTIAKWAGRYLISVTPSGSFMKGTANHSGTDIDLFISLSSKTPESLEEIYEKLFTWLEQNKYNPRRQDVSIKINVGGYSVDLVPAKRQDVVGTDHSLYRHRVQTWTKTNVTRHIAYVRQAGRLSETRIIKLWRDQHRIEFPSFYLELTVIDALARSRGTLAVNVVRIFEYLCDHFASARVIDPANTNNIISDDLTIAEKNIVKTAAAAALRASDCNQIVV